MVHYLVNCSGILDEELACHGSIWIEVSAMGQAGNTDVLDRPVPRDAVQKVRNILIEVNAIGRGDNTIDPIPLMVPAAFRRFCLNG